MIEENRNSLVIRDVDFESKQYTKFERAFSLYNAVTHKYDYSLYDILGNDIRAPATITGIEVQNYFTDQVIVKNYVVPKSKSVTYNVIHAPRDTLQEKAIHFLTSMMQDNDHNRMLNLNTGSGKTYVTIASINILGETPLVIVDTIDLAEQWKAQFLFHTDITEDEILILSGKKNITEALENKDKYKVYIGIHKTFGMMLDEDPNSVNSLMYNLGIGIRVFDECHVNFKNMCRINSMSNVNYTIYLTATPKRSNYKDNMLFEKVFDKVKSYDGGADEKYHTVILGAFNSHPTDKQKISVKTKYGFCSNKWANFVVSDDCIDYYLTSLKTLIDKFGIINKCIKTVIMLPTIDMINKTYDYLTNEYEGLDVGLFIGKINKDKRADELAKNIILTDQAMFGKGKDLPDLDCVINYIQLSSVVNLQQIIGRLRNNDGHLHILMDMTDVGYYECKAQQSIRKRFYKKTAKKLIEIKNIL